LLFFVRFKHAHDFRNSLSNVYMVLIYASINVMAANSVNSNRICLFWEFPLSQLSALTYTVH